MSDHINYLQKLVDALSNSKSAESNALKIKLAEAKKLADQITTRQAQTAQPTQKK